MPRSPLVASAIGESSTLDLFISFRSPYSYVVLPQVIALRDRYGIDVKVRPVLPMVMRGLPVPTAKRLYIAFDAKREADRQGTPFGHVCDPLGKGIGYCMAVFFGCAEGRGMELELAHSIGAGIWSEARDVSRISDLVHLAGRAGIGESDVRAAIEDKSWKERAKANRDLLTGLGLWGVPSLRTGGYSTWGQDRIPLIEAELARRSTAE